MMPNCFFDVLTPINTPTSGVGTFSVAPHTFQNLVVYKPYFASLISAKWDLAILVCIFLIDN